MLAFVVLLYASLLFSPLLRNPMLTKIAVWMTVPVPVALALILMIWSWIHPSDLTLTVRGERSGYWDVGEDVYGTIANHDFCEDNYRYSPLVAELHNTWSSVPIVGVAVIGMH